MVYKRQLVDRWLPPRLQRLRPRLEPRLFEGVHSIDIWLEKSGGWLHSLRAEVAGWIPDATFESWLELATLHKRKLAITLAASSAAFSGGAVSYNTPTLPTTVHRTTRVRAAVST